MSERATRYEWSERGVEYLRARQCAALTKGMDRCRNRGIYVRDDRADLWTVCAAHRHLLDAPVGSAGGANEAAEARPPEGRDAAFERLTTAVGNYFVVRYRYVHGTGGGATDEKMDATTAELLDAYRDARLSAGGATKP